MSDSDPGAGNLCRLCCLADKMKELCSINKPFFFNGLILRAYD